MSNIYYSPQDFGLEIVGDIEKSDGCYQFDLTVVWKQARGKYWIGQDSGCSCPSPFEDVRDVNELDGPYTKDGLRKRLNYLSDTDQYMQISKAEYKREITSILSRI